MRHSPSTLGSTVVVRRAALALALPLGVVATSCSRTAAVSDVYTALDGDGLRRRNEFFTDTKEIHCVTEAGIGRDGVTIEALIRQVQRYDFDQRQFVDSDRVVGQAENAPGRSEGTVKVDLSLQKPGQQNDAPYLAGRYVCEVRLDGELEGTATFNIQFPPCPTATIVPGALCVGFYELDKQCPAYGASSTEQGTCSCAAEGWRCP